jgi:hypothetical protein
MTAIEDPAPPFSADATGAAAPSDDLEHWLLNLRTDVAANPPDWIDADPNGELPASQPPSAAVAPEPLPYGQPETSTSEARSVGRHRTLD